MNYDWFDYIMCVVLWLFGVATGLTLSKIIF